MKLEIRSINQIEILNFKSEVIFISKKSLKKDLNFDVNSCFCALNNFFLDNFWQFLYIDKEKSSFMSNHILFENNLFLWQSNNEMKVVIIWENYLMGNLNSNFFQLFYFLRILYYFHTVTLSSFFLIFMINLPPESEILDMFKFNEVRHFK